MPVSAVARYWQQLRRSAPAQTRADLAALADRALLTLIGDEVELHDLQHAYLLLQAEDLTGLHEVLLAAYRCLLPPGQDRWYALPQEDPYISDRLLDICAPPTAVGEWLPDHHRSTRCSGRSLRAVGPGTRTRSVQISVPSTVTCVWPQPLAHR